MRRSGFHRHRSGPTSDSPRAARVFSREELRLFLLSLIDGTGRHGYELIRRIKSASRGAYAPSSGMVYPALAELEHSGLATSAEGEGGRRSFTATAAGLAEAEARAAEIAELSARLESLELAAPEEPAPVRRARANLDMVLATALSGAAPELIDSIVELIDHAARQIERLHR